DTGNMRPGSARGRKRDRVVRAQRPERAFQSHIAGAGRGLGGHRSSLLIRRSANTRPPDWQVGQYWNERVASDTSRTVSPQTGHAAPVRPWTRMDWRLP